MGIYSGDHKHQHGKKQSTFKLSIAHIFRPSRERVILYTTLLKQGKFKDGACTYTERDEFKKLSGSEMEEKEVSKVNSLKGDMLLNFTKQTSVTEFTVKLNPEKCAVLMISTGKPCCVISPKENISDC